MKELRKSMTGLLVRAPFFGALALRLRPVEDPSCPTAWTDGESLAVNPEWFAGLTPSMRQGLIAHEIMHVCDLHPWRRQGRDPALWNRSCDHTINLTLKAAGFDLPEGALCDPRFKNLAPEGVYGILLKEQQEKGGGNKPGQESGPGQPGDTGGGNAPGPAGASETGPPGQSSADPAPGTGWGDVKDAPQEARPGATEGEWRAAVAQAAAMGKAAGTLPGGLERLVKQAKQPACRDLLAALADFATRSSRDDFSYRRPNRRYVPHGLYLPSLRSESLAPIAVGIDTSGSVTAEQLAAFAGILETVLEIARPEAMHVLCCDSKVTAVSEYRPGDEIERNFPGGGGTRFAPVFDRIEEDGLELAAVIYITDLHGPFPDPPPYPVLFVCLDSDGSRPVAPWGETIWVPDITS